jgi:hypothetical protein
MTNLEHREITGQIIGAAFEVYNHLGYGFLEKVYKNGMSWPAPKNCISGDVRTPELNDMVHQAHLAR